jgi:hypothetical protein
MNAAAAVPAMIESGGFRRLGRVPFAPFAHLAGANGDVQRLEKINGLACAVGRSTENQSRAAAAWPAVRHGPFDRPPP